MTKLTTCPHCNGDLTGASDGRAGWWRFRVRLYDMQVNRAEPIADSDGDLEADQPGREVVRGLWKVAQMAAEVAGQWHQEPLRGLTGEDLERKVRGLRPTLSRNSGKATMRIEYDTRDSFQDQPGTERYLIRVDVLKAEAPTGPAGIPDESPYDQTH